MSELQKETLKLMGKLGKIVARHEKELQKHTDTLQDLLERQSKMLEMIEKVGRQARSKPIGLRKF